MIERLRIGAALEDPITHYPNNEDLFDALLAIRNNRRKINELVDATNKLLKETPEAITWVSNEIEEIRHALNPSGTVIYDPLLCDKCNSPLDVNYYGHVPMSVRLAVCTKCHSVYRFRDGKVEK